MPDRSLVIGGLAGTGSTTVGRMLAKRLGWEHVYGGGIMRAMADEAGLNIEDFMRALKQDPQTEREIDQRLLKRIAEGRVVVESRVVAWILPKDTNAFTVWLHCEDAERIQRVHQREQYADLAEARRRLEDREAVDADRYASLYDVNLTARGHFDLVIDTTKPTAEAVADEILGAFNAAR